ncbi:MAG: endo-1,4-beta-xylanase [Bacteroidales bacterium]|nr:endo-1,4-beta-xylanase [Bacteroidales bacterium]
MRTKAIFLLALASILSFSCETAAPKYDSLKDAYAGSFKMGCAISPMTISGRNPQAQELLEKHFNAISPDNAMKPESLHPGPDVWNFGPADAYVDYGKSHGMFVLGHTLCWHNQTPEFFWTRPDGTPKSREELVETLRSYIETVVTHFAGRVDAWDVVNEIVAEDGGFRDLGWVHAFGGDGYEVAKLAFQFANEYAPEGTEFYYNEFNVWRPSKLEGVVNLVRRLRADGLKVDGVGIQAHWGLNYPKNEYIEEAIDQLAELGVKVMITELDVDVLPISKEGQVIGRSLQDPQYQLEEFEEFLDPYKEGLPAEVEDQLAARYEELFKIFYNHRDQIDRVTFWGLHDGASWKNGSPIPRRTNYPLLFNRDLTPHKALDAVLSIPEPPKTEQ